MKQKCVILFVLVDYCKGDGLVEDLVQKSKSGETRSITEQHLNSLIDVWVGERRDVAEVFKLLKLHLTNGKLFTCLLSSKWDRHVLIRPFRCCFAMPLVSSDILF